MVFDPVVKLGAVETESNTISVFYVDRNNSLAANLEPQIMESIMTYIL